MSFWFTLDKKVRQESLVLDFNNKQVTIDSNLTPIELAIKAVQNIVKNYPAPYSVVASGGVDSQVMIWAWELSGVDYTIYHYSYNNWNDHDTNNLLKFVKKFNLENKLCVKSFDVLDYITSLDLFTDGKIYDCASPQILTYIRWIDQTPGTVVVSGNNIQLDTCGLNYSVAGLVRYQKISQKSLVPLFHLYDPSFAYSLFKPNVKWKHLDDLESYKLRCKLYQDAKFEIVPQYSKKTGFEKLKIYFDGDNIDYAERLKWQHKMSKRPFDIMFRYRIFDLIGDYSDTVTLIHHESINTHITDQNNEITN